MTEIFIKKFFFDWGHSSLFEMLVHIYVGGIGTLIIFNFILITTSFTPAMILRGGDISFEAMNMSIHELFFILVDIGN